jgi:hypothetical protein
MTIRFLLAAALLALSAPAAMAQHVSFGDDSGEYANDRECDDPRFTGEGMARSLDSANTGKDASDCQLMFRAGLVRLVRTQSESNVSECAAIDFGDDSSQWSNDNECDDPRFTGGGVDEILQMEDLMGDATDCRSLCESGQIWRK